MPGGIVPRGQMVPWGMRCERHGLAAGKGGQCALCHRTQRSLERAVTRQSDRKWRRLAVIIVAIAAAAAAFALVTAAFDSRDEPAEVDAAVDARGG